MGGTERRSDGAHERASRRGAGKKDDGSETGSGEQLQGARGRPIAGKK